MVHDVLGLIRVTLGNLDEPCCRRRTCLSHATLTRDDG